MKVISSNKEILLPSSFPVLSLSTSGRMKCLLLLSLYAFHLPHSTPSPPVTNTTVMASAGFSTNLNLNCPASLCLLSIDSSSFPTSSSLPKIRKICRGGLSECDVAVSKLIFSDVNDIEDKVLTVAATCGACPAPPAPSSPSSLEYSVRVGLGVSNWGELDRSDLCEDESLIIEDDPDKPVMTCEEFLSLTDDSITCETFFCPGCPSANLCDRTCGFCVEGALPRPLKSSASECATEGGTLDCSGTCVLEGHCSYSALNYDKRSDWLSNEICDDGEGYISDTGYVVDFNCERFGFDGGDCAGGGAGGACFDLGYHVNGVMFECSGSGIDISDSCSSKFCDNCELAGACDLTCGHCDAEPTAKAKANENANVCEEIGAEEGEDFNNNDKYEERVKWCVILTTTVSPAQSMTNTKRWSPLLRKREYLESLNLWNSEFKGHVIVVESSNSNIEDFKAINDKWEMLR